MSGKSRLAWAVLVSLFVSFSLDPMLSAYWADPHRPPEERGRLTRLLDRFNAWFNRLAERYKDVIGWALDHRLAVVVIAIGTFLASFQVLASGMLGLAVALGGTFLGAWLVSRPRSSGGRCGSAQYAESIGSSEKETNSDTSTEHAIVSANGLNHWPPTPVMNAIGTKTARIEKVVAATARPISSVPSCAARKWSFPISTWRTMFSRTTIASSIRMPIARLRPSSDIVLSVNPKAQTAMNDASTETGSASPVMTVERQELRNRNTMNTVSSPPSTSVT